MNVIVFKKCATNDHVLTNSKVYETYFIIKAFIVQTVRLLVQTQTLFQSSH